MSMRGGIDLGGTNMQAVVVDDRGRPVGDARGSTPGSEGPEAVTAALASVMREATSAAGVEPGALAGVGVGSPGDVDADAGTVANVVNMSGWHDAFPVAETLGAALGVPVVLGNDVQVATEAEAALGAGAGSSSVLGVFWGTGVGGGIVLDGKPWEGRGAAGEIGHTVVRRGGARCPCGRRGCMEAYAGRAAMEARARRLADRGKPTVLFDLMEERGRDRLTSGVWAKAAERGDVLAVRLIERAVKAVGAAIGSAINLLDVEVVVIGGGFALRFGEPMLERVRAATLRHVFADDRPPEMRLANLGDLGGAIGAALRVPEQPGQP
jgi:glucokinase